MEWTEMRNIRYKLEDRENRSRWKNLRVRGLPEVVKDTELEDALREISNIALKREISMPMLFERMHRIQRTNNTYGDSPRDTIVRFQYIPLS